MSILTKRFLIPPLLKFWKINSKIEHEGKVRTRTMDEATPSELNEVERKLRESLKYFIDANEKQLLADENCASEEVADVPKDYVKRSIIRKLDPIAMLEKNGSIIVAFKKEKDQTRARQNQTNGKIN